MTEDELVGWHHRLDGPEFEQAPGVADGQGSLVCCSPWGRKESDTTATELNHWQTEKQVSGQGYVYFFSISPHSVQNPSVPYQNLFQERI